MSVQRSELIANFEASSLVKVIEFLDKNLFDDVLVHGEDGGLWTLVPDPRLVGFGNAPLLLQIKLWRTDFVEPKRSGSEAQKRLNDGNPELFQAAVMRGAWLAKADESKGNHRDHYFQNHDF